MADSDSITRKDLQEAVAEIKLLVREVQDVLLVHFRNQLKVHDMRLNVSDASYTTLLQRLDVIEARILNLETGPTIRPQ